MQTSERPRSARKPRGQGASRHDEILAAAKKLFLTEGYEQATIRKIAAAVGVSSAALYLYFPDKDAILYAIAESTFEALLACLEESQHQPGSDLDRFRAGLQAYIGFGQAHPDEYRLTFLAKMIRPSAPGRPTMPCDDLPAANRSFGILSAGIGGLMQAGVFAQSDILASAEAVWASIHGLTALLLDQTEQIESPHERLIARALEILIAGLSTPK